MPEAFDQIVVLSFVNTTESREHLRVNPVQKIAGETETQRESRERKGEREERGEMERGEKGRERRKEGERECWVRF